MATLGSTSHDELETIFKEWLMYLDRCIQRAGDHVKYPGSTNRKSIPHFVPILRCQIITGHPVFSKTKVWGVHKSLYPQRVSKLAEFRSLTIKATRYDQFCWIDFRGDVSRLHFAAMSWSCSTPVTKPGSRPSVFRPVRGGMFPSTAGVSPGAIQVLFSYDSSKPVQHNDLVMKWSHLQNGIL